MTTIYPTYDQIRKDIHSWFKTVSGLSRVIWANQQNKRPSLPYATINIINMPTPVGLPGRVYSVGDSTFEETIYENQDINLSVQVYSDSKDLDSDAYSILYASSLKYFLSDSMEILRLNNLALINKGQINNIDEQLGSRWEKRTQQDLLFRFRPRVTQDSDYFDKLAVTGYLFTGIDVTKTQEIGFDNI